MAPHVHSPGTCSNITPGSQRHKGQEEHPPATTLQVLASQNPARGSGWTGGQAAGAWDPAWGSGWAAGPSSWGSAPAKKWEGTAGPGLEPRAWAWKWAEWVSQAGPQGHPPQGKCSDWGPWTSSRSRADSGCLRGLGQGCGMVRKHYECERSNTQAWQYQGARDAGANHGAQTSRGMPEPALWCQMGCGPTYPLPQS